MYTYLLIFAKFFFFQKNTKLDITVAAFKETYSLGNGCIYRYIKE